MEGSEPVAAVNWPLMQLLYPRALRQIQPALKPNTRGLDLGCGIGAFTHYVLQRGAPELPTAKILAGDADEEILQAVAAADSSGRVTWASLDLMEDAPLPRNSFHWAALLNVAGFIPPEQTPAMFRRIRHWLVPGAPLAFSDIGQVWVAGKSGPVALRRKDGHVDSIPYPAPNRPFDPENMIHYWPRTPTSYARELVAAGFTVLSTEEINLPDDPTVPHELGSRVGEHFYTLLHARS